MSRVGAAVLKARYIKAGVFGYNLVSVAFDPAGRVSLHPIDVPWPVIIDRIIYNVGGTSAGNVRLGIYREGATADSPAGAALVVESASVAQGTALRVQMVTVADTILTPGQYFVGIQGDNATGTMYVYSDGASLFPKYYLRAGGYGAFTDPCPTVAAFSQTALFMLRVKENLPAGYRL